MRTALLVVSIDSHFVELSRSARALKASGRYKPVLWFLSSYPTILRDVEICRSEGWEFHLSVSPFRTKYGTVSSFLKRLLYIIQPKLAFLLFFVSAFIKNTRMIKTLVNGTSSLIWQLKPVLLIVCEENVGYATHIPIRVCQESRIPTVVVPYTIANATEAAEAVYTSFEHQIAGNYINQQVARKYPHWVFEYHGRKLLRLPASTIIPYERSEYSPRHPWAINSEESAFIAVENEHMLDYYRNEKLPEARLILTGALYDDVLAESTQRSDEMRGKLIAELGLRDGLPLLLCALPPNQFPRDCEFSEYAALVEFWMEALSQVNGWNVVVRLHPRLTEEEIDHLKRFGVKISKWDTASLIPLCDLYVASVSATIRWAIACGKPVVNYDVYQMHYGDFGNVDGVLTVFSKGEFKDTVNRLISDRVYYEKISTIQRYETAKWGRLDGKSSERMLQLFDDVISGKIRRSEK